MVHFTVPVAVTSPLNGALLVATCFYQVAASALVSHETKQLERRECTFHSASSSKEAKPDIGILKCKSNEMCIEDEESSTGGRCVAMEHDQEEVTSPTSTQCTFSNGTIGMKCEGYNACLRIDESHVGCGSCLGDLSCYYGPYSVEENSCVGKSACFYVGAGDPGRVTVGSFSCHGTDSCRDIQAPYGDVHIGNASCRYFNACSFMQGN